jgi:SAM-dependent methyltransferase
MLTKFLQGIVARDRHNTCDRCYQWGGDLVEKLKPKAFLDVGCGDGTQLLKYLKHQPELFCGIEGSPALRQKAEARGLKVVGVDLNGAWPYSDNTFDVVHSSQVIEHLHNTRLFAMEIFRVLKPGGTAVVASENLTSFLNLTAMILGYTPFSLMRCCGWYLGNPLGLHYGETDEEGVPITHPAFAGITGHIRVLSVLQAKELFERIGFKADVGSIGLMPIPDVIGRYFEKWMPRRGHFLTIQAFKPL